MTTAIAVQELNAAIVSGEIQAKDISFANSLVSYFNRKGRLSDKQEYWAKKLVADARTIAETVAAPSTEAIALRTIAEEFQALFARGAKLPQLFFHVKRGDRTFVWRLKPNKGHDYIGIYNSSYAFIGTISLHPDRLGQLTFGRKVHVPEDVKGIAREVLQELNADPVAYAKKFGETGRCCYCNKELTDETSVAAGYGQTCAKTWGRKWGGRIQGRRASITRPPLQIQTPPKAPPVAVTLRGDAEHTYW